MKRLILTRHAKSGWENLEHTDFQRTLNERGLEACGLIGHWLSSNNYIPKEAFSSTATRCIQTWENINLRINFPQADGEDPAIINTDLISIFGFANLKIAFLGNFIQGQMFDSLMAYFNTIRIEVTNPHKIYFDIPSDEYSLNGYVAAKLKAKELCEDIVKTTSL